MYVFVLYYWYDRDMHIIGVYSSESKASAARETRLREIGIDEDQTQNYEIEYFALDN